MLNLKGNDNLTTLPDLQCLDRLEELHVDLKLAEHLPAELQKIAQ